MDKKRKERLEKEYRLAKRMGCGPGFWAVHCQELIKHGIKKSHKERYEYEDDQNE